MQKNYACISLICYPASPPIPNPNKKYSTDLNEWCPSDNSGFSGNGLRKKMPVMNIMISFKKHWS